MSNYTKLVNFAAKDALPSGDAAKVVRGTEINTEFTNIATAVNSKADVASPTFTGTPSAPTATTGTNTTQLATTAYVYNLVGGLTATPAELNVLDGITATTAELNILDGVTATAAEINILDGVTATTAELNTLDGITATVSELNILDGVTATTAEINKLDGVTSSTAELNILTGVTSTAAELNILDGVTATAAEINILDGVTATAAELNILDGVTATTAELNYVSGVTSNIQTQIDAITGGSTSGTVTSVGVSVPTGLEVADSPVTSSGTIALSFTSGYSIPTTAKQTNWDTAYGWGDHSVAGYLTGFTESDPTVPSHVKSITTTNVSNWNTAYGWGDHDGLYSPAGQSDFYSTWNPVARSTSTWYTPTTDVIVRCACASTGYYTVQVGSSTTVYKEFGYKGSAGDGSQASAQFPVAAGQYYRIVPTYSTAPTVWETRI